MTAGTSSAVRRLAELSPGHVNPHALAGLLRELAATRREGILHLSRGDVAKRIYFRDGAVIFAGSDEDDDRLGSILLREEAVTPEQLEVALTATKRSGEILGRVLVRHGVCTPDAIDDFARQRAEDIVSSLFDWPQSHYSFDGKPTEVRKEVSLELSVSSLLGRVAQSRDLEAIRRALADLDSRVRVRRDVEPPREVDALSRQLLDGADGRALDELVAQSPGEEEATLRAIYSLVLNGLLEVEVFAGSTAEFHDAPGSGSGSVLSLSELSPSEPPSRLGRYEVEGLLGRGAMGVVYRAKDPTIERSVAVKLIQTSVQLGATEFEKHRERFHREAKAAGKLLHPGIVAVFDLSYLEDATPFIVMEHVEGRTLRDVVHTESPTVDQAVRLAMDILTPLAYAHDHGVIHRDIKPTNILVTGSGEIKLTDFGIAHVDGSDLTHEKDVLGSPNYMAPEQLTHEPVDCRTDLFAFGVLFYWVLTKTLPFQGDSIAAIVASVIHDEPLAPSELNPQVTPALARVVMRCLAKDPENRFATALDVKRALAAACPDLAEAVEDGPTPEEGESDDAFWTPTLESPVRASSVVTQEVASPKRRLPVLLLPALGAAAIVGWLMFTPPAPEEPVALPAETASSTDAALYREAALALADDEVLRSRAIMETLLRRNPSFDGAAELAVRIAKRVEEEESEAPVETPAGDARLFGLARLSFEEGDLEASAAQAETLLKRNPAMTAAMELLLDVEEERFLSSLPRALAARHDHSLGSCEGELVVGADELVFESSEHKWTWTLSELRRIVMPTSGTVEFLTGETELMKLRKAKNYRFRLVDDLTEPEWRRYQRHLQGSR